MPGGLPDEIPIIPVSSVPLSGLCLKRPWDEKWCDFFVFGKSRRKRFELCFFRCDAEVHVVRNHPGFIPVRLRFQFFQGSNAPLGALGAEIPSLGAKVRVRSRFHPGFIPVSSRSSSWSFLVRSREKTNHVFLEYFFGPKSSRSSSRSPDDASETPG